MSPVFFVLEGTGVEAEFSGVSSSERQLGYTTVVSLLRKYAHERKLVKGQRLHSYIIKQGFDQETFLGNHLVLMYGKCGSVDEAREAFNRILEPNVYSWTLIVAAYAENGHLQEARVMFDRMPEKNVISWTAMLSSYAQNGHLQEARSLFEEMPLRTVVSWNALIAGFGQNGLCGEAVRLFRSMIQEGVEPNESSFVSAFDACATGGLLEAGREIHGVSREMGFHSFPKVGNTMIHMYGCCGCSEDARGVFDEMPEQNVIAWTSLLVAYSKGDQPELAERVFHQMPERSIVSWSAMIGAYARSGHSREALHLFRRMDLEGLKPDGVTFITTLYVCGSLSALEVGRPIFDDIAGTPLENDVTLSTALLDMFSRCGSLSHSRALFERMPVRDYIAWTCMLSAYAKSGEWLLVLETYYCMLLDGIRPNRVTLTSVLTASSHGGLVPESIEVFNSMHQEYGMAAEYRHYMCIVDALARAGQVREAEELINSMPFEPDGLSWRTLLGASDNPAQGSRVAENMFELDSGDAAPYVLLSNIHSSSLEKEKYGICSDQG